MSFAAKRELLAQLAPPYAEASRATKTSILDELTAALGYSRKHAVRLLARPPSAAERIRRPRERRYCPAAQEAMRAAWAAANFVCAKRLVPFLPALIDAVERHGHVQLGAEERAQLLEMSPATADRILWPLRTGASHRGRSTTRPGPLLKHRVPIRTFAEWNEARPGFTEADLVAHCGGAVRGSYLRTLVLTDVASGWTECVALRNGSDAAVLRGFGWVRQLLPFEHLGLDTDNGSEFLNEALLAYCAREGITFTRGRAVRKNDQCFVEQKNGAVVRRLVGYERYEGEAAYRQLTELYRAVRLYVSFFQPSMKLVGRRRDGSRVRRRYDHARTPYQRLAQSDALTRERSDRLTAVYEALDPVLYFRQFRRLQDAVWRLRAAATPPEDGTTPVASGATVSFHADSCMPSTDAFRRAEDETPLTVCAESAAEIRKRSYRRVGRSLGSRTCRTRPDPFEEVHDTLNEWLLAAPDCTGKDLLLRLQQEYPGRYPASTLRTLQRRLCAWRRATLLAFDERWLGSDGVAVSGPPTALKALPMAHASADRAPACPDALEAPNDASP